MRIKYVEKNEDISEIKNGVFIYCKDLETGLFKKDFSVLNADFNNITELLELIEQTSLDTLEKNNIDIIGFRNGELRSSRKLEKRIKKEFNSHGLNNAAKKKYLNALRKISKYFSITVNGDFSNSLKIASNDDNVFFKYGYGNSNKSKVKNIVLNSDENLCMLIESTEYIYGNTYTVGILYEFNIDGEKINDYVLYRKYNSDGFSFASHLLYTSDDQYVVTGSKQSGSGKTQGNIIILDKSFNYIRSLEFNSKYPVSKILSTSASELISFSGSEIPWKIGKKNGKSGNVLITKNASSGEVIWQRHIKSAGSTLIDAVIDNNDDVYLLVSGASSNNSASIIKLNCLGEYIHSKTFGDKITPMNIIYDNSKLYIGLSLEFGDADSIGIVELDLDLNTTNSKKIATPDVEFISTMAIKNDSLYLGGTFCSGDKENQVFVIKLSLSDFKISWSKHIKISPDINERDFITGITAFDEVVYIYGYHSLFGEPISSCKGWFSAIESDQENTGSFLVSESSEPILLKADRVNIEDSIAKELQIMTILKNTIESGKIVIAEHISKWLRL